MPRKLKTFITNLGFFELAVAVPSMKAALEAWGMSRNAFQDGFANETEDPKIIAAATAQPGTVLKRAVGSKDEFCEYAELPKSLGKGKLPKPRQPEARKIPKAKSSKKADRADIISFEKARAKRDKKRAVEEARVSKERNARERATDQAQAALEKARERHEAKLAAVESEQEKLNRRSKKESERWDAERKKLEAAVDRAHNR